MLCDVFADGVLALVTRRSHKPERAYFSVRARLECLVFFWNKCESGRDSTVLFLWVCQAVEAV